jgi:hypothetical protein
MKKFLGTMMVALITTTTAFASTDSTLNIELNFDKSTDVNSVDSEYLKVVPENWRFPSSTNLGKQQKEKFVAALELLEEVMNHEEFKTMVLSYEKETGVREFQKNYLWRNSSDRLSNEDIYKIIMTGDEKMRDNTIGEMNLNSYVKVCRGVRKWGIWCRKVVGSTDPSNSKWIKLNWKFYAKFDTPKMINNLTHEWLHLLGFLHGSENMRKEVPYIVGQIAEEVARKILAERKQVFNKVY